MPDGHSPLFGLSQRQPPSNVPAEQALLGAILTNNRAHDRVVEFLLPEHFADPVHGRIYQEIDRLIRANRQASAVTLINVFQGAGILDEVGGTTYLAQLLGGTVGIINAEDYGRAVHDAWVRRQGIDVGETMVNLLFGADPERDGQAVIGETLEQLLTLAQQRAGGRETAIGRAMQGVLATADAAAHGNGKVGLLTGLRTLDAHWRGMWPGTLDILAGRPGAGKTALALQIAGHVARCIAGKGSVGFWSLEMNAAALATRALSMETGIPHDDIREGRADASALVVAERAWCDLPIRIFDEPRTLAQLTVQARVERRRHGMVLAVVDHAAKLRREKGQQRMTETEWLNLVGGELHDLALALDIPVLLLWHMSRAGDRREEPRPKLDDLKYAGEGDADNVILLWRPERSMRAAPQRKPGEGDDRFAARYSDWERESGRWRGKAEAVFGKRRSGPEGSVILGFDGRATRFRDLEPDEAPPDMFDAPYAESEAAYG
jgi:replicative DNA helicase